MKVLLMGPATAGRAAEIQAQEEQEKCRRIELANATDASTQCNLLVLLSIGEKEERSWVTRKNGTRDSDVGK